MIQEKKFVAELHEISSLAFELIKLACIKTSRPLPDKEKLLKAIGQIIMTDGHVQLMPVAKKRIARRRARRLILARRR